MGVWILLLVCCASAVYSENVGWKSYFESDLEEFHDLPLTWVNESGTIPTWVDGTYVRNGPGRIKFKSTRRVLGSWLDGFAKLHSFKFKGNRVLFSGKFLEVPNYLESVKRGELVPQLTLNEFADPKEEWTFMEKMKISYKMMMGTGFDNNNPALWRIGKSDKEKGIYMAVTDSVPATQFKIDTLDTVGLLKPSRWPVTTTTCAHWMREPGTDNSINVFMKIGMTGPYYEVLRFRPEHTYQNAEKVASFKPKISSYMHSFSITENHVIFFFYPVQVSITKMWTHNYHVMQCLEKVENEGTAIYVVNLKTGAVTEREAPYTYSIHHANAFEKNADEIVVDLIKNSFEGFHDYPKLSNMLNPPAVINASEPNGWELNRYVISLSSEEVKKYAPKDKKPEDRYLNHFDFPTINENYRGKKYCIVYGWSAYGYSRMVLVKRNLCRPDLSRSWAIENHYSSEMFFVPNPEGKSEDDGILITIVFDGPKEQSYLLIFDAKTFQEINRAYLPHNIPWSAHGMYFPEAKF